MFKSKTKEPNLSKWFIAKSYGGVNSCEPVNRLTGAVIPSITGYAVGRFNEILDKESRLACGQPSYLFQYNEDGYARGTEPQLGALACWSGTTIDGHVAVVEQINPDNSIITSEYVHDKWSLVKRKPPSYLADNERHLVFQGFIYNPESKSITDDATKFRDCALSHVGKSTTWAIQLTKTNKKATSATFVSACAIMCKLQDDLIAPSDSCTNLIRSSALTRHGTWITNRDSNYTLSIVPCDIIGFRYSQPSKDEDSYQCDELGIVTDVYQDRFEYVQNGQLKSSKYLNPAITGYYRPKWSQKAASVLNLPTYKQLTGNAINDGDSAMLRECCYLNLSNYEPSIKSSKIKLCAVNYTSMYSQIYDVLDKYYHKLQRDRLIKVTYYLTDKSGQIGHASSARNDPALGDPSGTEVHITNWYKSANWKCVLRYPIAQVGYAMAYACEQGCNNDKIGYSQELRESLHKNAKTHNYNLAEITELSGCDCSSFMQVCAIAGGVKSLEYETSAYRTATMRAGYEAAGFLVLDDPKYLTSPDYLEPGDILLAPGDHTAMSLGYGKETPGFGLAQVDIFINAVEDNPTGNTQPPDATIDINGVVGTAKEVIKFCMDKGLNFAAGCGIAANIQGESGFKTNSKGDYTPHSKVPTSFGICQWHDGVKSVKQYINTATGQEISESEALSPAAKDMSIEVRWNDIVSPGRGTAMKNFVGANWASNLTGQLEYLWMELTSSSYSKVYNIVRDVPNTINGAETATKAWIRYYEIPQGYNDENSDVYKVRLGYCNDIWKGGK